MKTTVSSIVKGFSNNLRSPFAYAEYACAHTGKVAFKPEILCCTRCNAERERDPERYGASCGKCGCGSATYVFTPNEHNDEHRLTKVGDEAECERCDWQAEAITKLKALDPKTIQHTRYREMCGVGQIYVYKRDYDSPTGVSLALTLDSTQEVEDVLRGMGSGLAPLSPTEGLGRR